MKNNKWIVIGVFLLVSVSFLFNKAPEKVTSVAVMPLVNSSNNPEANWLGKALAYGVEGKIQIVSGFQVTGSSSSLHDIAKHLKLKTDDVQDSRAAAQIGKLEGADYVIYGDFSCDSINTYASIHIVDVKSTVERKSYKVVSSNRHLFDIPTELAEQFFESLDHRISNEEKETMKSTTRSAESFIATGKGLDLYNKRLYPEALKAFTQVIKTDPQYIPPYLDRGSVYRDMKQYDLALNDVNKAIELGPNRPDGYIIRSSIYASRSNYEKAIADTNRAIEIKPECSYYYIHRGSYNTELCKDAKALVDFNKAVELSPNDIYAYSNRGICYGNIGNYNACIEDFDRAIKINPYDDRTQFDRAESYYMRADNRNSSLRMRVIQRFFGSTPDDPDLNIALTYCNNAIKMKNNDANVYRLRGSIYLCKKEYKKALTDFNKAIQINPNLSIAFSYRGETYYRMGSFDKAIADYSSAIKLSPEIASRYFNRADTYEIIGEKTKALADYKFFISHATPGEASFVRRAKKRIAALQNM